MKTYTVVGAFRFRGNEPGSQFQADPKDGQIQRAHGRGSIEPVKPQASTPTKSESNTSTHTNKTDNSGDTGAKEDK